MGAGRPIAHTLRDGTECRVIYLDTEGVGGLEASATHDARIFSLATLLASHLIYNRRASRRSPPRRFSPTRTFAAWATSTRAPSAACPSSQISRDTSTCTQRPGPPQLRGRMGRMPGWGRTPRTTRAREGRTPRMCPTTSLRSSRGLLGCCATFRWTLWTRCGVGCAVPGTGGGGILSHLTLTARRTATRSPLTSTSSAVSSRSVRQRRRCRQWGRRPR